MMLYILFWVLLYALTGLIGLRKVAEARDEYIDALVDKSDSDSAIIYKLHDKLLEQQMIIEGCKNEL